MRALNQLAADRHPIGIVSGAGFEQAGDLLNAVADHWPVLGNEPATIATLKDPIKFAKLCTTLAIPHPETCFDPPHSGEWLMKQKGGSGGSHIKPYFPLLPFAQRMGEGGRRPNEGSCGGSTCTTSTSMGGEEEPSSARWAPSPMPHGTGEGGARRYFQRKVSGEAISALFLAGGDNFQIIGFSRQWASPATDEPFRYGGAVQPAGLSEETRRQLTHHIAGIVTAIPLKGLNSADFIVDGDQHWLLEINPRPGATLDIFPGELLKAHVDACRGKLPGEPFSFAGAHAAAIVYAERDIPSVAAILWPKWAMDRQAPGTRVAAGEPLCTVKAEARSAEQAMKLLKQREVSIRQRLEGVAA
jgi:predicted ATP-grasp superfamily ATP-dependent carboligase